MRVFDSKYFQQEVFQYFERMDFFEQANDFILFESISNTNLWDRNPYSTSVLQITKINKDQEKGWKDIVFAIDIINKRVEQILGFWLCKRNIDKEWSLTDCYSFELMKELNIYRALSADKHFEQYGYEILLKEN